MDGGLAISQLRRHDAGFFLKSTGNGRLNVVDGTMQPAPDSLRKARSSHSISSGAAVDSHSERDPRISSGTAVDSVQARSLLRSSPRTLVERFDIEPFPDFSAK